MFRARGFIFRKTVVRVLCYLFTCQRYKQSTSWKSLFGTALMVTEQNDEICLTVGLLQVNIQYCSLATIVDFLYLCHRISY